MSCDSGSSSSNNSSDNSNIQLSGKVVAIADDVNAVATLSDRAEHLIASIRIIPSAYAASDTGSDSNIALPNADVSLYKVFEDGSAAEQVDIGSVSTDTNGDFTISNVLPPSATDDFYYEVRIEKDSLSLSAPAFPKDDTEVNISPESELASKVLSEVVTVANISNPPLPNAEITEAIREMVVQDAGNLIDDGSIAMPSAIGVNSEENLIAMANGLAAAGGNTEIIFKAAAFNSEYQALNNDQTTSDAVATGYIKRVIREACNQEDGDYMPQSLAEALGEFFNNDGTVTTAEIVTAYNNNSAGDDIDLAVVVNEYQSLLYDVESNLETNAALANDFSEEEQLVLLTKHNLNGESYNAATELSAEQAATILQLLSGDPCELSSDLDLYAFAADLLDDTSLAEPRVSDITIYHNSGFGCNEGVGEGHFYAEATIYSAGKTVSNVNISSSDTSALGGDGNEDLSLNGNTYRSDTNGVCVSLASEATYTVTATFTDSSTATQTVTRNHPRIPEASSEVLINGTFVAGSNDSGMPSVVNSPRPIYQWTSPATMLTNIINDAQNTAISSDLSASSLSVKYTYEFSHIDTTAMPISPAGSCPSISSGRLYSVDSFIPTTDCDISACATALSINTEDVACRMNIQSFLVDESDNIVGQAAGHFRYFCVDTDDDDTCG